MTLLSSMAAGFIVAIVGVVAWLAHMDFTEYPEDFDWED